MSKVVGKLRKRALWKLIYLMNYLKEIKKQLHWTIPNPYYKRGFLTIINQRTIGVFTIFLWLRIIIVALVLQWIWYYNTSWVSNIDDLVSVLTFYSKLLSVCDFAWIKYLFVSKLSKRQAPKMVKCTQSIREVEA